MIGAMVKLTRKKCIGKVQSSAARNPLLLLTKLICRINLCESPSGDTNNDPTYSTETLSLTEMMRTHYLIERRDRDTDDM